MKKTATSQDIARVFYEALNSAALEQLKGAAQKLSGVSDKDPAIQKRIQAALPSDALPQVRNFLLSLAREGELVNLSLIVKGFEDLIRTGPQMVHAEVTSAVALEEAQRTRIASELQEKYDVQPDHLHFRVDDSLIGGLIIRIGDKVFDNSLRTRLGAVQRSMLAS